MDRQAIESQEIIGPAPTKVPVVRKSRSMPSYSIWDSKYSRPHVKGTCEIPKILTYLYHSTKTLIPRSISIGPYYCRSSHSYRLMDDMKLNCVIYLLEINPQVVADDYYIGLINMENEIRSCFRNQFHMGMRDFITMLFRDASFIYCMLSGFEEPLNTTIPKPNIVNRQQNESVFHDLFLFENQVPFTIIEKVNHVFMEGDQRIADSSVRYRIAREVTSCLNRHDITHALRDSELPKQYDHLLHLVHTIIKPIGARNVRMERHDSDFPKPMHKLHSAIDYYRATVKFKARMLGEGQAHSILDISFSKGILAIPPLSLDVFTLNMLRNLLVMEQIGSKYGYHVTSYLRFVWSLAATSKDVKLLRKKGILIGDGSNRQVKDILDDLMYKRVKIDLKQESYLDPLFKSLVKYRKRRKIFALFLFARG